MPPVVIRTPYRITLGGGGLDYPTQPDGLCVTATINQYIHTIVTPGWDGVTAHHAHGMEHVTDTRLLDHRLLRAVMTELDVRQIEFAAVADLPSGTGLGSSSAFTVGAINAIWHQQRLRRVSSKIAAKACEIEVGHLGDPIGYQDQYATALGGLLALRFNDGNVSWERLTVPHWLRLRMLYTGVQRSAAAQMGSRPDDATLREHAETSLRALTSKDPGLFAKNLTAQWDAKHEAAPTRFHDQVDDWIRAAQRLGAHGGKLMGAGNGGFLLFAADETVPLHELGLREVPIVLTRTGTQCM